MKRAFPILGILTAILLSYSLYMALVVAPTDAMQGEVYRIIYYHVPSAWTAMLFFFVNFIASVLYLVRASPAADRVGSYGAVVVGIALFAAAFFVPLPEGMRASAVGTTGFLITGLYFLIRSLFSREDLDVLAVVAAEVGVVFCTVVLVTGPIWARPVWGIWWTWDIRLTSTLVLWLIYVSYLMLRRFSASGQTPVLAAALAVFGMLDMPLVYFSIWFFRTQHPQPVLGGGGSIDPRMLHVWLLNFVAFLCFAILVGWSRFRLEKLQREVNAAHALNSLRDAHGSAR